PDITKGEAKLGTPLYMSPEQASGKPTDHRSDIFAFGVVLYEMLAGGTPFQGDDEPSTLKQISQACPVPIEQLRPDVPERRRDVVTRVLEKAPQERYDRMEDAVTDLRVIGSGFEDRTTTVSLAPSTPRRLRRRAWIFIALAAILIPAIWMAVSWISRERVP